MSEEVAGQPPFQAGDERSHEPDPLEPLLTGLRDAIDYLDVVINAAIRVQQEEGWDFSGTPFAINRLLEVHDTIENLLHTAPGADVFTSSEAREQLAVLYDSIEAALREHQSATPQPVDREAPMSDDQNPYDVFRTLEENRREAREHTDAMTAQLRADAQRDRDRLSEEANRDRERLRQEAREDRETLRSEMREDRAEILGVARSISDTLGETREELAEVRTTVDMLKWYIAGGIAIAGLVVAIIQAAG